MLYVKEEFCEYKLNSDSTQQGQRASIPGGGSEEGATICQEVVFHVALERLCLIWSGSWSRSTDWLKGSPLPLLQVLGQELCLSQQRIRIVL